MDKVAPPYGFGMSWSYLGFLSSGDVVVLGYESTSALLPGFINVLDSDLRTAKQTYGMQRNLGFCQFTQRTYKMICDGVPSGSIRFASIPSSSGQDPSVLAFYTFYNWISMLDLTLPGPSLTAAGIVNAASGLAATVSNGEIVSVFGPSIGPTSPVSASADTSGRFPSVLGDIEFSVNGQTQPLLYAGPGQVNVVLGLSGCGSDGGTQVYIAKRGLHSAPVSLQCTKYAPGLFTLDGSGTGQVAALNQDGSLNSPLNPASRGSTLVFYATGLGQTNPFVPAGTVASAAGRVVESDFGVMFGNIAAQVQYAGLAPTLVSGGYQINVTVPSNSPTGPQIPLTLRIGQQSSQQQVFVSIQ